MPMMRQSYIFLLLAALPAAAFSSGDARDETEVKEIKDATDVKDVKDIKARLMRSESAGQQVSWEGEVTLVRPSLESDVALEPMMQRGSVEDESAEERHEKDIRIHNMASLVMQEEQNTMPCDDMSAAQCCTLSPRKVRMLEAPGHCSCIGPPVVGSLGTYITQDDIDAYCHQILQPCGQLPHASCCEMAPKMVRFHQPERPDQCWCSGPLANSNFSTQDKIDAWCDAVVFPCSHKSEGHCCSMSPRQVRVGQGDQCYCTGPVADSQYTTQMDIDIACSKVVKPCRFVSQTSCCRSYPKQVRYNDGSGMCWCGGLSVGGSFTHQTAIDDWCERVENPPTTATPSTTIVIGPTTSTTTTTPFPPVPCDELSDGHCCSLNPKKMRVKGVNNTCWCEGVNFTGAYESQVNVDYACSELVKPCEGMTKEMCCRMSPKQFLYNDTTNSRCWCNGPYPGGSFPTQVSIDAYCGAADVPFDDNSGQGTDPPFSDDKGQGTEAEPNVVERWSDPTVVERLTNQSGNFSGDKATPAQLDAAAMSEEPLIPCSELNLADCCLMKPMMARLEVGRGLCKCGGPFPGLRFDTQLKINQTCNDLVQPCDVLPRAACCKRHPKEVRYKVGNKCWCSGVSTSAADDDFSSQDSIDTWCQGVEISDPLDGHLDKLTSPCSSLSEVACCMNSPMQIRFRQGAENEDRCWCSSPFPGGNYSKQEAIDQACQELVQPCGNLSTSTCCGMSPRQARYKHDAKDQCWCGGPSEGMADSGPDAMSKTQAEIDAWCDQLEVNHTELTPVPTKKGNCSEIMEAECCISSPAMARIELDDRSCQCTGPVKDGLFPTQSDIDSACAKVVMPCSQLDPSTCCALTPMQIRYKDTVTDRCWCSGPTPSGTGTYSSQEDIDQYCSQLVNFCDVLTQEHCCLQSPKRIRTDVGNNMCLCRGSGIDGVYNSQKSIDDACDEVVRPCAQLHEHMCCLESPKMIRMNSSGECWCEGPTKGTSFETQDHIDQACSPLVRDCSSLTPEECCLKSPPQLRVTDDNGHCWCSGPFATGGSDFNQSLITSLCDKFMVAKNTSYSVTASVS